jgi:hypothetical protein
MEFAAMDEASRSAVKGSELQKKVESYCEYKQTYGDDALPFELK